MVFLKCYLRIKTNVLGIFHIIFLYSPLDYHKFVRVHYTFLIPDRVEEIVLYTTSGPPTIIIIIITGASLR